MIEDKRKIDELEEKISELTPEYKTKKEIYDDASNEYFKMRDKRQRLQSEIDALRKKIQVKTFKKSVGKGELLSFRTFFDEIRKGRDFAGKTLVWSFKNGKSGMFVSLWVNNTCASKTLLEKYHYRYIFDPDILVELVRDFSTWKIDDFMFDAFAVGSMVDGHRHHNKKLDDVFIFICDTKTFADFDDIADTEGLYFFEILPYVEESPRVSETHYGNYKLYPLEVTDACSIWRR